MVDGVEGGPMGWSMGEPSKKTLLFECESGVAC